MATDIGEEEIFWNMEHPQAGKTNYFHCRLARLEACGA